MLKITNFDYVGYELDYAQSTHILVVQFPFFDSPNRYLLWGDTPDGLSVHLHHTNRKWRGGRQAMMTYQMDIDW